VELPNGRMPARKFVDSLDDKAAARIDAFIERLRVYGNRMQGKFVKKLTDNYSSYGSSNSTGFFEFSFSTSQEC
jgi:hypothetical protein